MNVDDWFKERKAKMDAAVIKKHGSLEAFYLYRGQKTKQAKIAKLGEEGYRQAQSRAGKLGGRPKNERP